MSSLGGLPRRFPPVASALTGTLRGLRLRLGGVVRLDCAGGLLDYHVARAALLDTGGHQRGPFPLAFALRFALPCWPNALACAVGLTCEGRDFAGCPFEPL